MSTHVFLVGRQPLPDLLGALTLRATEVVLLTSALPASEVGRVSVRCYSIWQKRRMEWPGLMGKMVWRGPTLAALWPLLRFGEAVQIGKATTLGFGRYRLHCPKEMTP